ncbi:MAG TPA: hypothetical protein VK430_11840 [Xanthobacteraceae bacterium]|nr:hypothetical protein [Xanthobacteraceae bacterium]
MTLSDGIYRSIYGRPAERAAAPAWLRALLQIWLQTRFHTWLQAWRRGRAGAIFVAAVALAGCGLGEGPASLTAADPGQLFVDPARYDAYHCNDLAARWKVLLARENELRGLMDKAAEGGGGGAVIGALAYRADYEAVLSEEKLLQHRAVEKNCGILPSTLQSDQTIH